jgi:6,7-dimethyl-8-ribityllumazine synthase
MGREYQGYLSGKGLRFGIVVARFNELITSQLLAGARDAQRRHGVLDQDVDLAWVPGSLEIPITAQRLARRGSCDAVICLGAVIRGSTAHFDYVAAGVAQGVSRVSLETGVPAIFGVLTTDTIEQALERAGTKAGNRGWDAAVAAIEMATLLRTIGKTTER